MSASQPPSLQCSVPVPQGHRDHCPSGYGQSCWLQVAEEDSGHGRRKEFVGSTSGLQSNPGEAVESVGVWGGWAVGMHSTVPETGCHPGPTPPHSWAWQPWDTAGAHPAAHGHERQLHRGRATQPGAPLPDIVAWDATAAARICGHEAPSSHHWLCRHSVCRLRLPPTP